MNELVGDLEGVEGHARALGIQRRLAKKFPDRSILFSDDGHFLVGSWAAATKSTTVTCPSREFELKKVHGEKGEVQWYLDQGHEQFEWKGHHFDVFTVEHQGAYQAVRWSWIIGPDDRLSKELFGEVVDWNSQVHGEVLVFTAGCFSKSHELQAAIENTQFDDLVLPPSLSSALQADVKHFLSSRELYAKAGAAWKRGMLLMGPPGNGKTHAIKALIKQTGLPCVYVKSFSGRHVDPSESIPQVFKRARALAPCVVVLEDLDSLVDDENRSFLLNELDGFAVNDGLLTIASTNHPERLDPSLLHRPSRFDRKYRFDLPEAGLRRRYLEAWAHRLASPIPEGVFDEAVEQTAGFTFAYLKEVGLSTQMQWVSEGQTRPIGEVLSSVVAALKEEILATPAGPPPPPRQKPRFPWDFG